MAATLTGDPTPTGAERAHTLPPVDVATVDLAPLWTGHEERVFQAEVLRKRSTKVDGWNLVGFLKVWFLGPPWLTRIIRVLHVVAVVSFLILVRDLAKLSSWGNLVETFRNSAWTILLLFIVTFPTRRLGLAKLVRYWAMGTMLAPMLVYYTYGPIHNLITTDNPDIWVVPVLEEVLKALPVIVLLVFHRRLRFQYGLSDFLIIGFILGAGFAFTEDAMWGRAVDGGFRGFWGWIVPGMYYPTNGLVVGHAVWTALFSIGLALIVLHRRKATMIVLGAVLVLFPVFDHMVNNDHQNIALWIRYQLIGTHSLIVLFVAMIVFAVVMDLFTLVAIGERDHLLPSPWRNLFGRRSVRNQRPQRGSVASPNWLLALRYARQRNGLFYHKAYEDDPWPTSRAESQMRGLQATATAGSGAGILTGVLRAHQGWAPDPAAGAAQGKERWFNASGWTPYFTVIANGELSAGTDEAPGRPFAIRQPANIVSATWGRNLLLALGVAVAYAVYRIATGSEPSSDFMFAPAPGEIGPPVGLPLSGAEWLWGSLPASGSPVPGPTVPGGFGAGPPAPPPAPSPPPPPTPGDDGPPDDGPNDDTEGGPSDDAPDGDPDGDPEDDSPPEDEPEEECP